MNARLAFSFLLLLSQQVFSHDFDPAKQGMIDLRSWNTNDHPMISLDGEWQFYWNRLLLYSALKKERPSFAQLSIPWNEQLIDGKYLPNNGCATYALKILMPPMDSVAFAVPAVFNSYAFYVNDKLICSSGKVGTSAAEMVPQWRPRTVSIAAPGDTLQVIFQIANFQETRGGCSERMQIGTTSYLVGMDSAYHTSGFALIILFLITTAVGFIIYFLVRSSGFLFLALLAFAYVIRFLFSDLYFYYDFGIDVNWAWAARIEYITIPLIVLFASLFMATIYPREFKRAILYVFVILNLSLILVIIFSPFSIFSTLLLILQVVGLALVLYTIYAILRALTFQRKGAWVSALSTGVFALVAFYNIYAFITATDLNRTIIHSGYALALILNVISLQYRTPVRLRSEEQDILRFSDLYNEGGSIRIR